MTDQAVEQSGQPQQVAAPDLKGLLKDAFVGGQPQGQASEEQSEQQVESEAQVETTEPEKFRVPAFEGDGYEELTPDELKSRFLMQKDYTRKTQEIAEERRKVEAMRAEVESAAQERIGKLENDLQVAARLIQSFDAQVDWEQLRRDDPSMYLEQREAQAQRVRAWEQAKNHAESLKAEQRKQRRLIEAQRLVEKIPEWLDPERAKAESQKLVEGASQYGLTAVDLENLDDHRLIVMMRDALAFRDLQGKTQAVKAEAQKAPQLAKPGAKPQGNPQALATHRAIQKIDGSRDALRNLFKATLKS